MIIHFEDRDWDFELEDLDVSQARHIKRFTQMTLKEFYNGFRELDPECLVGLYWLMKAQNGVAVDMNKVNFPVLKFAMAISAAQKSDSDDEEERPTRAPKGAATKTRA